MDAIARPTLPQEIYEIIIENLSNDQTSLQACCLVASSWRLPSQKVLHGTMVFPPTIPSPGGGYDSDESQGAQSATSIPKESALALVDRSIYLLRYAHSLVFRVDRVAEFNRACQDAIHSSQTPRALDPSLTFFKKINTLSLPLLSSLKVQGLSWPEINPDLQYEWISMLSQRPFKKIHFYSCELPYNLPWLRFVGPKTRSFRLDLIEINYHTSADSESVTLFDDIPSHPAPNLTNLDMQGFRGGEVMKWVLQSLKVPGDQNICATSNTTCLHGCSWRESIITLSLRYCTEVDNSFKLIQACSSLKRVNISFYSHRTPFPFYEVMCHPTLEYVRIELRWRGVLPWLISSFKPSTPSSLSLSQTAATKLKTVFINMPINLRHSLGDVPSTIVPGILAAVREFDEVVSRIPCVEVNLELRVCFQELLGSQERIEDEPAKMALVGLEADVKTLKLEVCCW